MFMLSGPVELLFEDFELASLTWIGVMIMGVVGKVLVWLSIRLFLALMVYLTVLTNCSLKALAFSCGSVASLPLKLMVVLGCEGCLFPFSLLCSIVCVSFSCGRLSDLVWSSIEPYG